MPTTWQVSGGGPPPQTSTLTGTTSTFLRGILVREPRNTVRWVDLAREHLALGHLQKAMKAIRIALALAPYNRFVLRSASALFVEAGDLDRAVTLLQSSPATEVDPWLLAPLIAISDLAGSKQHSLRTAQRVLNADHPTMHLAELSAALGTVELSAGSSRRGRQLLRRSADDSTENALAQIEWFSQRTNEALLDGVPTGVPRTFEARARRATQEADWREALHNAELWFTDQPFSSEAATFASFCACESEDWEGALRFTRFSISSHPEDPALLNNHAFACIGLDKLPEAARVLVKARGLATERIHGIVRAATEALLLFRSGQPERGRRRYRSAIDAFLRIHERDQAARAALMLAGEEALIRSEESETSWRRADDLANGSRRRDVEHLRTRIAHLRTLDEAGDRVSEGPKTLSTVEPLLMEPPELAGC